MNQSEPNVASLNPLMAGAWMTQGVHVAAELGIADVLGEGPASAEELARRTGAQAGPLYRLLRALASMGIFAEDARGRFALTPLGQRLRDGAPESQRAMAMMAGAEFYGAWGQLLHSVRTGEQGFVKAYGAPFFEYMTARPQRQAIYDAAMNGVHGAETGPMLDAYDFSGFRTVVDIGGGNGLMLAEILRRNPGLAGILFELPAVAERARPVLARMGVLERCQVVAGDFFEQVPAADACLLRHVIHDWQDEQATTILRNCRSAVGPGGRVLVVETVIPPGNGPCFGKWLDLMMLLVGGRERTGEEYERLFAAAGLRLARIVPTAHEVSVIEGTA